MSTVSFAIVTIAFLVIGGCLTALGHPTEGMVCLSAAAGSFALECRMRAAAAEKRTVQAEQHAQRAERTAQEALEATQTLRREDLPPKG